MNELFNHPVGGATPVACTGNCNGEINAKVKYDLARFTHKSSVILASSVAILAVCFDFWAQVNGKPYQLHDWIIGLILIPLGGAGIEAVKHVITSRRK